jgi:hypothetical protein
MFKYVFSENGLVAFKDGAKLAETSFIEKIGEEKYQVRSTTILYIFRYLDTISSFSSVFLGFDEPHLQVDG